MKFHTLAILLVAAMTFSCSCSQKSSADKPTKQKATVVKKASSLLSPGKNVKLVLGDEIPVEISYPDTMTLDSAQVFYSGVLAGTFRNNESHSISTAEGMVGKSGVRVKAYFTNGVTETHSRQVEVLSDLEPQKYSYKLVKEYKHDESAYTQGLLFYNGSLYEGTGNYNQSTLRKVRVSDGEVLQVRNNAADIFGEGITIFQDKIYQLTYKSQTCFVYDLNTFEEIQKLYFQNKEGWGLTNTDSELIMSDGTNVLYFLDPNMFTINSQIEVYDHEGPVMDLNELEYIEGKIYANRYYYDEIVIVDPESGKLEGRIDLKGILPVSERNSKTNVLNGIAWNGGESLFVTGKYWPKMYEIEVVGGE